MVRMRSILELGFGSELICSFYDFCLLKIYGCAYLNDVRPKYDVMFRPSGNSYPVINDYTLSVSHYEMMKVSTREAKPPDSNSSTAKFYQSVAKKYALSWYLKNKNKFSLHDAIRIYENMELSFLEKEFGITFSGAIGV